MRREYFMAEIRIPPLIPPLIRGDAEGRGDQRALNVININVTCLIAGIIILSQKFLNKSESI